MNFSPELLLLGIVIVLVILKETAVELFRLHSRHAAADKLAQALEKDEPVQSHPQTSQENQYLSEEEFMDRYPKGLPIVDSFVAGEFICDHCGQNSFYSLISMDPETIPGEVKEELTKADDSIAPDDIIVIHPNVVNCVHCGSYFAIVKSIPE